MIKKLFLPKKVKLSEVAEPQPSRAAGRVLNDALKRAAREQSSIRRKAEALRSSN